MNPTVMQHVSSRLGERTSSSPLEGLIKGTHAIRRKEEHAREILELTEEDSDEGVAFQVMNRALLEEYVCLIDEYHGSPSRAGVEDASEFSVKASGMGREFAAPDNVKWSPQICCKLISDMNQSRE